MGNKYQDIRFKWLEERGFNVLADDYQYHYAKDLFLSPYELQGVFCDSPSGTGKTTISTLIGAYGVEKETYSKIVYIRGTDIIGDELGFLPGELDEKIAPFMQPFIEALDHIKPGTYEVWKEEGKAVATTSTYMRGITIDDAFVILDETQNMTLGQLQAIYTRQTKNCKIVTIGSLRQIDNENMKLIAGKTPFEIYMLHYQSKSASYHSLKKNFRGDWSKHADNIQKTVKDLLGIEYDPKEFEDEIED